jgi:hypothetical protein
MSRRHLESLQNQIAVASSISEVLDIYDTRDSDNLSLDEEFELDEFRNFRIEMLNDESLTDDDFDLADFCSGGDLTEED